MDKIPVKQYRVHHDSVSDTLFIKLDSNILQELNWKEGENLKATVKLSNNGNVCLIERVKIA